jgi:uncharacterized membrane protein YhhN
MISFFFIACLLVTFVDWLAVAKNWKSLEYLAKPAVMILLLAWLWTGIPFGKAMVWFSLGLVFSLAGDILLLLPGSHFLPGLLAFLLAHLAYIAGFNQSPPIIRLPAVLLALSVLLIAGWIFVRLSGPIRQKHRRLVIPVLIYSMVIALMLISALLNLFRPEWLLQAALFTSLGAALFFLSDSMLAWNRFVSPSRQGRLPEITAYHLGQILIVAGVILQFR